MMTILMPRICREYINDIQNIINWLCGFNITRTRGEIKMKMKLKLERVLEKPKKNRRGNENVN